MTHSDQSERVVTLPADQIRPGDSINTREDSDVYWMVVTVDRDSRPDLVKLELVQDRRADYRPAALLRVIR